MYTGNLWLDFESDEEDGHYAAKISKCTLHSDVLVLEFAGAEEGHKFSGSCTLQKKGHLYTGSGNFAYAGRNSVASTVSLELEEYAAGIGLHGTWQDQGDADCYQLEAELLEVGSAKGQANR